MTKTEMKCAIMNVYKTQGCAPGDGMPIAYWNATFLQNAESDLRELFEMAVEDLIVDGYLSDKPIQQSKSPLGSLNKGLWLIRY